MYDSRIIEVVENQFTGYQHHHYIYTGHKLFLHVKAVLSSYNKYSPLSLTIPTESQTDNIYLHTLF